MMRAIGATDGFILRPFLSGGMLLGAFGAILSLVLYPLCWSGNWVMLADRCVQNFGTTFCLTGLDWDEATAGCAGVRV